MPSLGKFPVERPEPRQSDTTAANARDRHPTLAAGPANSVRLRSLRHPARATARRRLRSTPGLQLKSRSEADKQSAKTIPPPRPAAPIPPESAADPTARN